MESSSIYKYRVKEKWIVNDNGFKLVKYYPQYKSKLYGWRNMFTPYYYTYTSTLTPDLHIGEAAGIAFGGVGLVIGLIISYNLNVYGLLVIIASIMLIWTTYYLINKTSTNDLSVFNNIDEAKKFITTRINIINDEELKKKRRHNTKENLPSDKIHHLNLKVERIEKLKRINQKFRFGWILK